MDNEYYKRYEPFFGSWHIKRFIGAGSYGKVFEIERRDFDMVFTGALKAITIPADKSEYEQVLEAGMDREGASTYFRDYVAGAEPRDRPHEPPEGPQQHCEL